MGRPPKAAGIDREPVRVEGRSPSRGRPNWELAEENENISDSPDRFHIPRDQIPEGYDLQWVTDSIFGQPQLRRYQVFEKDGGWDPVHQEDFGGQFNGRFMKKDQGGEISYEGMVLMARPLHMSQKARLKDRRAALEQVAIKEQALRGGDIGASLDTSHPSAVNINRNAIKKSVERISIPEE